MRRLQLSAYYLYLTHLLWHPARQLPQWRGMKPEHSSHFLADAPALHLHFPAIPQAAIAIALAILFLYWSASQDSNLVCQLPGLARSPLHYKP
jgi:hypothetical protein